MNRILTGVRFQNMLFALIPLIDYENRGTSRFMRHSRNPFIPVQQTFNGINHSNRNIGTFDSTLEPQVLS